jgi:ribosomal protein L35
MKNKMKVSKTILKRIKNVTSNGKVIVMSTSAQHLASNKSKRRRMAAKNYVTMAPGDVSKIKKLI